MMFELDTNKDELKSGLVRVEGRKDFLENEVQQLMKECGDRDLAKQELRKMMLLDKIWLKLSQSIALIDEEFPRI